MVLGQILILRKNFKPIQLLQIPLSFLFGYFTDIGMLIAALVGFGISLAVIANVIMNSGEAFVKAIADTLHKNFGNVKIIFDISYVALSVVLSLILFNGSILYLRYAS